MVVYQTVLHSSMDFCQGVRIERRGMYHILKLRTVLSNGQLNNKNEYLTYGMRSAPDVHRIRQGI